MLAFLVLPMVIVVPVSFTDQYYLSLPKEGLSLRHYQAFFEKEIWLAATFDSLVIAVFSTLAALLLGTLCAIGCWRLASNASEAVRTFMLTPIIVPTIVQALATTKKERAAVLPKMPSSRASGARPGTHPPPQSPNWLPSNELPKTPPLPEFPSGYLGSR